MEIPQDAHLRAVGEGASNVSLMDMSLQPEENTAFVRLVSWGGDAQEEVECYADGALCDVRAVSLTDGESQGVLLTVPRARAAPWRAYRPAAHWPWMIRVGLSRRAGGSIRPCW